MSLRGGGENNDGDTIYDYDVQYEVHVQNRLQDQSTIYVKFIIDDAILYSGNIITGQSDIKTGTIKVKRGQETLKCNASTYGCTAETTKDYKYLVYQYSGSHVWADKQPIHGKINNNAVKEENIPLDWISFIFQGQRWIKMYLTIDKWN